MSSSRKGSNRARDQITVNAIDPAVPSQPRERKFPDIFPSYKIWTCQFEMEGGFQAFSHHFPIIHNMLLMSSSRPLLDNKKSIP